MERGAVTDDTYSGTVICPACGHWWVETWPRDNRNPFEHVDCGRCAAVEQAKRNASSPMPTQANTSKED